jgi:hypothetical protein
MVKQFKEKFSLDKAINQMWDFIKSNIIKILQEDTPVDSQRLLLMKLQNLLGLLDKYGSMMFST